MQYLMSRLSGKPQGSGYKYDYDPDTQTYKQIEALPMKKGGKVSASRRADGCITKGHTKGKMV